MLHYQSAPHNYHYLNDDHSTYPELKLSYAASKICTQQKTMSCMKFQRKIKYTATTTYTTTTVVFFN